MGPPLGGGVEMLWNLCHGQPTHLCSDINAAGQFGAGQPVEDVRLALVEVPQHGDDDSLPRLNVHPAVVY